MATKAGTWVRVSTGGQDEANQVPDIERHCSERGYDVTKRYVVKARRASIGEQAPALAEMLHDMRTGQIEVLVCWHSDRLERRGAEALFKLIREVQEAGGRIEAVLEPQLGATDVAGSALTALSGIMAHEESVKKSERELIAVRRIRDNGALWGLLPWGYVSVGEKYSKTAESTEDGKLYIPEMFQRIADGQSLNEVGRWLRAGPLPRISAKTILRMIRNKTYMGQRTDLQGRYVMTVPPLVDAALWEAANNRLTNAPRGRRTPTSGTPALLTSVIFCARCHAPMYRQNPHSHYFYYRCHGHEPENKGCGNMIDLAITDAAVRLWLSMASNPWTELRRTHRDNHEATLADIRLALSDLPKQGLSRKDEQAERERLWAEEDKYTELQKRAGEQPKWKEVAICATCDGGEYTEDCEAAGHHGETVGEHFKGLDYDGQRAMLLKDVKIYAKPIGDPELSKVDGKVRRIPILRMESRLFKMPVEWIGEAT
jgi:DNA invertase Pin-like site-specific DNA recombinase